MEAKTVNEPLTMSVPEAGKMLGIGRDASYRAARANEIPVIRVGKKWRVPRAALERLLGLRSADAA